MKGIILAGGSGSRLQPITKGTSKQLLPVYDKPMIYYPLTLLIEGGVTDILIITTGHDLENFKKLLRESHLWGVKIQFVVQESPRGIAEALLLGETFIAGQPVALILGDNIFHSPGLEDDIRIQDDFTGARIFAYRVSNPEDYGVVTFDQFGIPNDIIEKPKSTKSNFAVTGLYLFDSMASIYAKELKPSSRNELEITDLNSKYLTNQNLDVVVLPNGSAWLDMGTVESLYDASIFVRTVEHRQGIKIGVPEAAAFKMGLITASDLAQIANAMGNSPYGKYLLQISENR
jgi:glucose-1-phosphate thymidylyltransferase